MSDVRHISDEYTLIGQELIDTEESLAPLRSAPATIVYLASEGAPKAAGKSVQGKCEKVADKYKWGIPADFTITLFEPNIDYMTDEQIRILIFHELLHLQVDGDDVKVVGHDLEDFKEIIDRYGTEWNYDKQMTLKDWEVAHESQEGTNGSDNHSDNDTGSSDGDN